MYFFLSNLSSCDLLLATLIVPLMLNIILRTKQSISLIGCLVQFYFFGALATTECILLAVMSYDRYVAICDPLRYALIMGLRKCVCLAIWSWGFAFTAMVDTVTQISKLDFCGYNVINHFFCDLAPLLKLSCSDTTNAEIHNFVTGIPASFIPLMYIIATYAAIFVAVLKIPTTVGRQKAFYTCSSHLTVVSLYYGTLVITYLFMSKDLPLNTNKLLSLLYTVVTPMVNPIIYSLRNKEIQIAFSKFFHRQKRTHLMFLKQKKIIET
ncbi:olfactory receptor 6P1-like [Gastrophryne carolinensis]